MPHTFYFFKKGKENSLRSIEVFFRVLTKNKYFINCSESTLLWEIISSTFAHAVLADRYNNINKIYTII